MGSLLPGWGDGPASPEGFEHDSERRREQKMGYFAKLEKSRSLRPAEPVPFVASVPRAYTLRRQSVPLEGAAANAVRDVDREHASAEQNFEGRSSHSPPRRQFAQQAQHAHAHHQPLAEGASAFNRSSQRNARVQTDWEQELLSLGGGHKVHPERRPPSERPRELERFSFSRHMEHSALNYVHDPELEEERRPGHRVVVTQGAALKETHTDYHPAFAGH